MKTLLLIPILLLAGCIASNQPLYDRQPEIVKVDAQIKSINQQLSFLTMLGVDLDLVSARRHKDLISVFYTAFEVAFADGNAEKFQLMLNRVNAQIDALNRLMDEVNLIKPMDLEVPEVSL
ncbi:hypothetical protein LCGC14_2173130 [marine sediment metagenome]|uniref:Uncharacterized protein n=1 Tax=marine sediment metagenome TaxID=412755 RepID=A0A0F9DPD1_9ZZZZ